MRMEETQVREEMTNSQNVLSKVELLTFEPLILFIYTL